MLFRSAVVIYLLIYASHEICRYPINLATLLIWPNFHDPLTSVLAKFTIFSFSNRGSFFNWRGSTSTAVLFCLFVFQWTMLFPQTYGWCVWCFIALIYYIVVLAIVLWGEIVLRIPFIFRFSNRILGECEEFKDLKARYVLLENKRKEEYYTLFMESTLSGEMFIRV